MKRLALVLVLAVGAGACASTQARSDAVDAATQGSQIVVDLDVAPDQAAPQVMQAFLANQLSVSSSQNNLIEANLPREQGVLGQYDINVRALVVPHAGGSEVTLYGEEHLYQDEKTVLMTTRVSSLSRGRARNTWSKLLNVATALQPDAAKRHVAAQP